MPQSDAAWQRMVDGLRTGDPEIVAEFYHRHRDALRAIADRQIASGLRRRVGASDVVQSAFRSFFRQAEEGRFQFEDSERLWSLMCAITLTKVREQVRYHRREKRDVYREAAAPKQADSADMLSLVAGSSVSSEALVEFNEQFARLMESLEDEERTVLSMKMGDCTNEEIAETLGISERTVRRVIQRLKVVLQGMFATGAD